MTFAIREDPYVALKGNDECDLLPTEKPMRRMLQVFGGSDTFGVQGDDCGMKLCLIRSPLKCICACFLSFV